MRKLFLRQFIILFFILFSINSFADLPIYVWTSWGKKVNEKTIDKVFSEWKKKGVKGVCLNVGFNIEKITIAAKAAKAKGLEYHAWIPTLISAGHDSTWYTVNRLGESAYSHPVYVGYYKTLDPNKEEVQRYLIEKYEKVAAIPEVDFVQLDYIRYADVILARGLWEKYGLVMNEEYPKADYCYCDKCVSDFKNKTGIDIKKVKDPSKCKEWAQFRCDVLTHFVNRLSDSIHAMGKKVSADVFPGPSYARKMVRQEWNKWNLDAFFPMNYNDFYSEGPSWVGKVTDEEVKSVSGKAPIYSGLFICQDWRHKTTAKTPGRSGLTPSELKIAVEGAIKSGATGVCLFTPERMTKKHWRVLSRAVKK